MHDRIVAIAFVSLSLLLLMFRPDAWSSALAVTVSLLHLSFVLFLDRARLNDRTRLDSDMKDLKAKLDSILIGRGLGR